jgi:hypothetical protein
MLKNIQAYFRTFGILTLIFYLFFTIKINSLLITVSYFILFYFFLILYLTYFIYSLFTKKNNITYYKYISLIKDKEFILFKDSLFKFYGSTLIILFLYLFKYGQLIFLLEFKFYLFYLTICLILTNNHLILFLFNTYTEIKISIHKLN